MNHASGAVRNIETLHEHFFFFPFSFVFPIMWKLLQTINKEEKKKKRISLLLICSAVPQPFSFASPRLCNQILKYCETFRTLTLDCFWFIFICIFCVVQMNSGLLHYRWHTGQVWLLPPSHTNTAQTLKRLWHLLYDYLMAILSGMKKAASKRPRESFNNRNRLSSARAKTEGRAKVTALSTLTLIN